MIHVLTGTLYCQMMLMMQLNSGVTVFLQSWKSVYSGVAKA